MRWLVIALAALGVLVTAPGCGDSGDCLSRAEVEREVDELAMGFETSSEKLEANQEEIQGIRGQQC
jgi:hypothetical protein